MRRVLIVDDLEDAADLLAEALRASGARVRTAYQGAQALAELAAEPADIVILDLRMPDMDGFEVARRIRTGWPGARIVAHTGLSSAAARAAAAQAGCDDFVLKPCPLEQLQELLGLRGR